MIHEFLQLYVYGNEHGNVSSRATFLFIAEILLIICIIMILFAQLIAIIVIYYLRTIFVQNCMP